MWIVKEIPIIIRNIVKLEVYFNGNSIYFGEAASNGKKLLNSSYKIL